jgi:hypothetical protein
MNPILKDLLGKVALLELIEIDRPDECCGFGGSFCVTDEAVSAKMGYDRVHDFYHRGDGAHGHDIWALEVEPAFWNARTNSPETRKRIASRRASDFKRPKPASKPRCAFSQSLSD